MTRTEYFQLFLRFLKEERMFNIFFQDFIDYNTHTNSPLRRFTRTYPESFLISKYVGFALTPIITKRFFSNDDKLENIIVNSFNWKNSSQGYNYYYNKHKRWLKLLVNVKSEQRKQYIKKHIKKAFQFVKI